MPLTRFRHWGLGVNRISYVDPTITQDPSFVNTEWVRETWNTVMVPYTEGKPSLLDQQIVQITYNCVLSFFTQFYVVNLFFEKFSKHFE